MAEIIEKIYNQCKNDVGKAINWETFQEELQARGIRKHDNRLKGLMRALQKKREKFSDLHSFKELMSPHVDLMGKIFNDELIVPDFKSFTKEIEQIYWKCKVNKGGKNASYIPQLAHANPNSWGVAVCTIDGQRFTIGDVHTPFTIQSCSKPLTYAVALENLSADVVHKYVGQEPSGRIFNELCLDHNNKPHNPMINSGAIMTASLVYTLIHPEMSISDKFDFVHDWYTRIAGGEKIAFNNSTYLSEREAADRNYALGFYMREVNAFPQKINLRESLDFYFQLCSMETTADTMSVVASTLANGGVCPTTGEKVLHPEVVRDVLTLMHSCGMYNYSGQFAFKVGLPAKSGVAGGVLLVIPNFAGIFTWSPPLDECGNSVRGIQFCEELVKVFKFHPYENLRHVDWKKNPRERENECEDENASKKIN